jgi:hypothetical protein
MKGHDLQILLSEPDLAALLQCSEANIRSVIMLDQAPRGTWPPNRKRLKWRMSDLPAWARALERLKGRP